MAEIMEMSEKNQDTDCCDLPEEEVDMFVIAVERTRVQAGRRNQQLHSRNHVRND